MAANRLESSSESEYDSYASDRDPSNDSYWFTSSDEDDEDAEIDEEEMKFYTAAPTPNALLPVSQSGHLFSAGKPPEQLLIQEEVDSPGTVQSKEIPVQAPKIGLSFR